MSVILFYDFCCKNWQFNQTVFPELWLPLSSPSFYLKCTNSVWRSYIVVTSGDGKGLNVRKLDCFASGVFKISDIDECSESPPVCLPGQRCVNYAGGHYCSCRNGYRLNSITNRCEGTCTVDPLHYSQVKHIVHNHAFYLDIGQPTNILVWVSSVVITLHI